jgi:chromosome partitioning protein
MRIGTINTKGGTGKTTTAVNLAMALHRTGRTLAVDCDPVTASLLGWSEQCTFPFSVISLPVKDVHRRLVDLAADYEHVVIDTPPGDLAIIGSALMAVDVVIVPVAPTGLDLSRMLPTFKLIADAEPMHPVDVGVLLTKVRAGTVSARGAREVLAELGYPILDTEIPLAELYAGQFGTVPADIGRYEDLMLELAA